MAGYEPKAISGEHAVRLSQRIKDGDFTIRGLVAEPAGRGPKGRVRFGLGPRACGEAQLQKGMAAGEREGPGSHRRRAQWTKYHGRVEAEQPVFIDET